MKGKHETKPRRWTAVDTLYWAGQALVAVGVGAVYVPAGLIWAGLALIAGAVLIDRAGQGGNGK